MQSKVAFAIRSAQGYGGQLVRKNLSADSNTDTPENQKKLDRHPLSWGRGPG